MVRRIRRHFELLIPVARVVLGNHVSILDGSLAGWMRAVSQRNGADYSFKVRFPVSDPGVVFKLYPFFSVRERKYLVVNHFSTAGLAPKVRVPRIYGYFLWVAAGKLCVVVVEERIGTKREKIGVDESVALGRSLARFNEMESVLIASAVGSPSDDQVKRRYLRHLSFSDREAPYYCASWGRLVELGKAFVSLDFGGCAVRATHGDIHNGNILWEGTEPVWIDLEGIRRRPVWHDVMAAEGAVLGRNGGDLDGFESEYFRGDPAGWAEWECRRRLWFAFGNIYRGHRKLCAPSGNRVGVGGLMEEQKMSLGIACFSRAIASLLCSPSVSASEFYAELNGLEEELKGFFWRDACSNDSSFLKYAPRAFVGLGQTGSDMDSVMSDRIGRAVTEMERLVERDARGNGADSGL